MSTSHVADLLQDKARQSPQKKLFSVGPDTVLRPTLPYAISKQACENYVRHFRESGRLGSYVIARFFGAFGPYEPERKIYTRLVRWAMEQPDQPFEIEDHLGAFAAILGVEAAGARVPIVGFRTHGFFHPRHELAHPLVRVVQLGPGAVGVEVAEVRQDPDALVIGKLHHLRQPFAVR